MKFPKKFVRFLGNSLLSVLEKKAFELKCKGYQEFNSSGLLPSFEEFELKFLGKKKQELLRVLKVNQIKVLNLHYFDLFKEGFFEAQDGKPFPDWFTFDKRWKDAPLSLEEVRK